MLLPLFPHITLLGFLSLSERQATVDINIRADIKMNKKHSNNIVCTAEMFFFLNVSLNQCTNSFLGFAFHIASSAI